MEILKPITGIFCEHCGFQNEIRSKKCLRCGNSPWEKGTYEVNEKEAQPIITNLERAKQLLEIPDLPGNEDIPGQRRFKWLEKALDEAELRGFNAGKHSHDK